MTLPDVVEQSGGSLNPTWVEWLMNWPIGWTSLERIDCDEFEYWKAASAKGDSGNHLREMWFNREAGAPSQGLQPDEQHSGKRGCPVFALPPLRAQENQTSDLYCLWETVSPEAQHESEIVREFGVQQDSRQTICRTAVGVIARVDRLKAIGNGQVPAVAALAWRVLMEQGAGNGK